MKVLFISTSYPSNNSDPRGIFIHLLARALHREGIDITVLAPGAPSAPTHDVRDGVKVQRVTYWLPRWQALTVGLGGIVPNLRRKPWLAVQVPPLLAALVWRALRIAGEFDLIHCHWVYPSGIAGVAAAIRHELPLILTSHGGDLNLAHRSKAIRWLSRRLSETADVCVGVSHAMVEEFSGLGISGERVRFIALGVDTSGALPRTSDEHSKMLQAFARFEGFRITYVGSLIPRKSVETLLLAHAELETRGYKVASAIVGPGPSEEKLRSLASELSLRNVYFAGAEPPGRVQDWMLKGNVLVLPSRSEGRGLVLVEAMALGLPVIASDIPGPRELVIPGQTGLLFQRGDAMGLADCLQQLIDNDHLAREMGRRGRDLVEAEGLTDVHSARNHISLYEEVLRARSKSRKKG